MPFEMSLRAITEEELIEVASLCANLQTDVDSVIDLIRQNEKLDRENDKIRREVNKHLLAAVRSHNMKDYTDVDAHVHASLQRLNDQEQADLQDDKPRIDALIKLSNFSNRLERSLDRVRSLIKKGSTKEHSGEAHS
jgi:hypothetical protein